MTTDLDMLDAERIGFDPMDLVRAVPGVLQQTGQALVKKPAASQDDDKKASIKPSAAPSGGGIGLGWKIGGGAVAAFVLLRLLKR